MRVLGVDPGTYNMGIGVVDTSEGAQKFVHSQVVNAKRSESIAIRLNFLFESLTECIDVWNPDSIAIESPFVGKNMRSALAIGQAQAIALLAAAGRGLSVRTYSPREVKQSVAGYGGSSKEQVRDMVWAVLDINDITNSLDASDAIAIALCHANSLDVDQLLAENDRQ